MGPRILALALFGVLAFAAIDSAELRRDSAKRSATSVGAVDKAPEVKTKLGGNPWPPPPK